MLSEDPPTRPWESVSTDLFSWNGDEYLLVVDSYSHFIEIAKLNNTSSKTVILHTKSIFARHGIPKTVKSDNGPQYSAEEYKRFSKEWGFSHVTTSPYHSQANGLAEKSVQIVKQLLKKAKLDGRDPYLSLLEYRNTSVNNIGSPAQLCMSRRLNSVLPSTPEQLTPKIIDPNIVIEKIKQKQHVSKEYYDKGARQLCELQPNDSIRMQVQNRWVPGTVVRKANTPRSYVVRGLNGQEYRRNRKHLRKVNEPSPVPVDIDDIDEPTLQQQEPPQVEQSINSPVIEGNRTSYGRVIRPPARYQNFVRHY